MAPLIYLDTHVLVCLYAGRVERIPENVREPLNDGKTLISPIVLFELQYLVEIGRFTHPAAQVLDILGRDLGLKVCDLPFREVAVQALELTWTRDPFDRLIVAQAALGEATLVTKDQNIHGHYSRAMWARPAPE